MQLQQDLLPSALDRLADALAAPPTGRERDWSLRVAGALGAVARALRAHAAEAETADGFTAGVDLTRPSLVRRVGALCHEHRELLAQANHWQREARRAAQAFTFAGMPPEPAAARAIPDFGLIRQGAGHLLRALHRHREEETALVLESVTTDIGVGD